VTPPDHSKVATIIHAVSAGLMIEASGESRRRDADCKSADRKNAWRSRLRGTIR